VQLHLQEIAMPCKSRATASVDESVPGGKQMRWLYLNDALKQITSTTTCTLVEAQRYLKAQIGARTVPVKWGDSDGANDLPDPEHLQGTKFNLSGTGLAYDKRKYRPLMVLHSPLQTAWQRGVLKGNVELSKDFESEAPDLPGVENENDGSRWMTLVSAEEHIEVMRRCDSVEALRQLKEEIGDGVAKVRWADLPVGEPDVAALKVSQFILFGTGLAPDSKEGLRPLLVNSEDVLRLWPQAHDVKSVTVEPPRAKSGPGRPTVRDRVWETLSDMQNRGEPLKGIRARIAKKVVELNNVSFDDSGWSYRAVLDHVRDWQLANTPDDAKKRK
jgi:hypothetical protein